MSHPLLRKLQQREAMIGVIGLGYVGLPLVLAFGKAGFRVRGFDVDARKPEQLLRGESYIRHIPASDIQDLVQSGRFSATTDYSKTSECDALIICAVVLSTVMGHPVEMKPLMVSKANTAIQIVLAAEVLAELTFDLDLATVRHGLVLLSGLLTVASAAAYLVSWLRHMSGYGEGTPPQA